MQNEQTNSSYLITTPSIQEAQEIERGLSPKLEKILDGELNIALKAEELDLDLQRIGILVGETIEQDRTSMSSWLEKYERAVRLAKMIPKNKVKNFPFEKSSNLVTPHILQAAIDFNARTTPMIIERQDICTAKIVGKEKMISFIINPVTGQEEEVTEEQIKALKQLQSQQQQGQQQQQPPQQQGQPPQQTQPQTPQIPQVQTKMGTEKQDRADRVAEVVNWDLTTGIPNWRELKDKELFLLPIVGTTFKLNRQSAFEDKRISTLFTPDLLICDHEKDSFMDVRHKSFDFKMNRNDVITSIETGQFVDLDMSKYADDEKLIEFTESHTWLDLDDDGYEEPYLVVIEKFSDQVVSIAPRFVVNDVWVNSDGDVVKIDAEEYFTCTIFMPDPCGGFMGMGWGVLLGSMFEAITTGFNQLIDAGTLANTGANSGLIRSGGSVGPRAGNRQRKGEINLQLGKFVTIESSGTNPLSDDIVNFPFAGPNQTLFSLLEFMTNSVTEMTTAASIEVQANEAAEMYLARLRESMVSTNAIRIRVAQGMTREVERIIDIHRKYLTPELYKQILNEEDVDKDQDYQEKTFNIAFTADPSQGSDQERTARAKLILDEAKQDPSQTINLRFAYENFFESIGIKDKQLLDKILPPKKPDEPDPLSMKHAETMELAAQAEMVKGEADQTQAEASLLKAKVDLMKAQQQEAKLQEELDKLRAETMEILSKVDKNEVTSSIAKAKQLDDSMKTKVGIIREGIDSERDHDRADRQEDRDERSST